MDNISYTESTTFELGEHTTVVSWLAQQIREAAAYLTKQHGYSLEQLRHLSGGGNADGSKDGVFGPPGRDGKPSIHPDVQIDQMHKNSILKIHDLECAGALLKRGSRDHWVRAAPGTTVPARWLWNAQIETLAKLELIIHEADRLKLQARQQATRESNLPMSVSSSAPEGARRGVGRPRKTAPKAQGLPVMGFEPGRATTPAIDPVNVEPSEPSEASLADAINSRPAEPVEPAPAEIRTPTPNPTSNGKPKRQTAGKKAGRKAKQKAKAPATRGRPKKAAAKKAAPKRTVKKAAPKKAATKKAAPKKAATAKKAAPKKAAVKRTVQPRAKAA